MSFKTDFENLKISNSENTYIIKEFVRYFNWIYSNYSNSPKSSKENYYKLIVIKKTINIMAGFKKKINSGSDLEHIKGIGQKTIQRINEIIQTGKLSEIDEQKNNLANQIDAVKKLSEIYGIGPVKASEFYSKFGIKTIDDLVKAYNQGLISLSEQMKLGIKYANTLSVKIPRVLIARLDLFVCSKLAKLDKNFTSMICGSYRRGKDYSSDVDILITHKDLKLKSDCGKYLRIVLESMSKYFIVDSLTTSFNTHYQGFGSFKLIPNLPTQYDKTIFNVKTNVVRIDIIVVPIQYFYFALLHFTGSGDFNQKLRLHAKSLGYKLSEYGLVKINQKSNKNNDENMTVEANSEKDIFDALLLKYVPPEKR